MPAPRRRCASTTATGVGREDICNYHDLSWRFLILEAEQDAEAEIRHQFDGYFRALISLVIKQQLEKRHILHQHKIGHGAVGTFLTRIWVIETHDGWHCKIIWSQHAALSARQVYVQVGRWPFHLCYKIISVVYLYNRFYTLRPQGTFFYASSPKN